MAIAFVGDAHGCVRHLLGACVALQVERQITLDAVIQVGDLSIARNEDTTGHRGYTYLAANPAQRDGIAIMQRPSPFGPAVRRARSVLGDRPVLFIRGNHEDEGLLKDAHTPSDEDVVTIDPHGAFAHVADGAVLDIAGWRIGFLGGIDAPGSPWHFDLSALDAMTQRALGSVEVLVTHDGPHAVATNWRGRIQGSKTLTQLIERLQPRLHVNGHYHHVKRTRVGTTTSVMLARLVNPATDPWGRDPENPTQQVSTGSIGILDTDSGSFEYVDDPWLAHVAGEQLDLDGLLDHYL